MRSHVCVVRHEMGAGGICAMVPARMLVLPAETRPAWAGRGGSVSALAGAPDGECSCAGRVPPAAEARS
jgi:hypothetical protein